MQFNLINAAFMVAAGSQLVFGASMPTEAADKCAELPTGAPEHCNLMLTDKGKMNLDKFKEAYTKFECAGYTGKITLDEKTGAIATDFPKGAIKMLAAKPEAKNYFTALDC